MAGPLATASVEPVHSLSEYYERLVALDYLRRSDLVNLFKMRGWPPCDGRSPVRPADSPFKIYLARGGDPGTTIFLATQNFTYGQSLMDRAPFKRHGAVVFRKEGDGRIISSAQATDPAFVGVLPGASGESAASEEGKVWK